MENNTYILLLHENPSNWKRHLKVKFWFRWNESPWNTGEGWQGWDWEDDGKHLKWYDEINPSQPSDQLDN